MNELEQARERIDGIDAQLAALFEARMEAAQQIAAYKKKSGMPIFDAQREQQVVERNGKRLSDQTLLPYYTKVLSVLMEVSKEYQKALLSEVQP